MVVPSAVPTCAGSVSKVVFQKRTGGKTDSWERTVAFGTPVGVSGAMYLRVSPVAKPGDAFIKQSDVVASGGSIRMCIDSKSNKCGNFEALTTGTGITYSMFNGGAKDCCPTGNINNGVFPPAPGIIANGEL